MDGDLERPFFVVGTRRLRLWSRSLEREESESESELDDELEEEESESEDESESESESEDESECEDDLMKVKYIELGIRWNSYGSTRGRTV